MAEIHPFRGVRYDLAQVGDLSDVVAPPYDVIDPDQQEALHQVSPYNIIRLELAREEPGDDEYRNRYTRAADTLKSWRRDKIVVDESQPALYVYEQTFAHEGQSITRRGFLARVRVEPLGQGTVFPHEETMPGPKKDRLSLYQATGFNISPIFALYPDESQEVFQAVHAGIRDRTPLFARDRLGVENRLWIVDDVAVLTQVQGLMGPRPLTIADGHHRFETAVRYRDLRREQGHSTGHDDPSEFVLTMLVGMSDPGLIVQPTHRLIRFDKPDAINADHLLERLSSHFDVQSIDPTDRAAQDAWELIQVQGTQDILGFAAPRSTSDPSAGWSWVIARLTDRALLDRLVPDRSADWRGLGVSILHRLVLDHLLADRSEPTCRFVHTIDEVVEAIAQRTCQLACLVPSVEVKRVQQIAQGGERMPAKSTYFYPKLLSGLVLNPIA